MRYLNLKLLTSSGLLFLTLLLVAAGCSSKNQNDFVGGGVDNPAAGVSAFTGLSDTPSTYSSQSLKVVRVNAGETALEFAAGGAGDLLASNNLSDVDAATTSFDNISPLTTKGDIFGYNGTVHDRIAVGTNDQVLIASSSATNGIAWADAAADAFGKQTLWIPSGGMLPTASNGASGLAQVETTSGRPDINVLDFDATSDEHAQFDVAFPKSWNEGTVTFQAFWTTTAADTDGIALALQGVAVSDADTIDVAYGAAVVVTDDAQTAAEDLYVTAESAAITIAGTPAEDDLVYFRVFRDVSDANDDMTEDARLIGIKLFYTTNANNDD